MEKQPHPYIHLGSYDISLANQCWNEQAAGASLALSRQYHHHQQQQHPPDYDIFEESLSSLLIDELGYQPKQIIRQYGVLHENTDNKNDNNKNHLPGSMSQYKNHILALAG